jgi:hypothetical protein
MTAHRAQAVRVRRGDIRWHQATHVLAAVETGADRRRDNPLHEHRRLLALPEATADVPNVARS